MNKLFILLSFAIAFLFVSNANAQTPITFAKGASEKTMTITVAAGKATKYAITVKKDQVVNINAEGDIGVSKTNDFPVVAINVDYKDGVDRTQDGEAYYSLLAGRNGKYIITVSNSDKKRARTFKLNVKVSNDKADFQGGEEVDQ